MLPSDNSDLAIAERVSAIFKLAARAAPPTAEDLSRLDQEIAQATADLKRVQKELAAIGADPNHTPNQWNYKTDELLTAKRVIKETSAKRKRLEKKLIGGPKALPPGQLMNQDEGDFVVRFLSQHVGAVESVVTKVKAAIKQYRSVGIPIRDKLLIALDGEGAAKAAGLYWPGSNPPTLKIAPKEFNSPTLAATISHELGHYIHDCVVPGGMTNREVEHRYSWAVRQKQNIGESERDDIAKRRRLKELEAEKKELLAVKSKSALPPKGKIFDYKWRSGFTGKEYTLQARILRKSGKNVTLEVIDPPRDYMVYVPELGPRSKEGHPISTVPAYELLSTESNDALMAKLSVIEKEYMAVQTALVARNDERKDEYARKFETQSQRHAWAPTQYSRKDPVEWFAELCTTYALGHLDKDVEKWLVAVVSTGKAPDDMALAG